MCYASLNFYSDLCRCTVSQLCFALLLFEAHLWPVAIMLRMSVLERTCEP